MECEVNFVPTRFNVTVIAGRNVTVQPTKYMGVPYIDENRRDKNSLIRQFELIANDYTNTYVSMVGTAFNASMTDLITNISAGNNPDCLGSFQIGPGGVRNSIQVMIDDILGAYAAVQLVVSDFKSPTLATIRIAAIAIGETHFAVVTFFLNAGIIAAFLIDVVRTKW